MPRDKILIVDDEDLIRWSLRQKITNWGYHVTEAAVGKSALELVDKDELDVRRRQRVGIDG